MLALLAGCSTTVESAGSGIKLSAKDAQKIGRKIWQNECGGTVEGLTSWNSGEDFASLGIGHFIWYPPGKEGPFEESFPKLIAYYKSANVTLPAWLEKQKDCPWTTKAEFKAALNSREMKSLRQLLTSTVDIQTSFIVARLEAALPKMLAATDRKSHVEKQFYRMAATPGGLYALIDYVNFKGEGTATGERYKGQGWGLLQVLEGMNGKTRAVDDFSHSAKNTLSRRVKNSPPSRNEQRWLKGWHNRCDTYRQF